MCGNLAQRNVPSMQSDVGEASVEVTFKTTATSCKDFIALLDENVKPLVDGQHCAPTPGDSLKLKITLKSGKCDDAVTIAMDAQKIVPAANYGIATFTCIGPEGKVPAQ
ncbi:unnamed protein product [Caenorhabditis nigoni]